MDWLSRIGQLMLLLMFLVTLHELGHFLAAKYFGVRVERFFIFFDVKFSLWKKKIGDTLYGIGWLPLGGYVKLSGMIDESMDKEQMKGEPQPWEFRVKPAWQRLIIMLGGVIVNFVLAIIIFSVLFMVNGKNYTSLDKLTDGIAVTNEDHKAAGLQDGDIPWGVDGVQSKSFEDFATHVMLGAESMTVLRNNKKVELPISETTKAKLLESRGAFFETRFPFSITDVAENSPAAIMGLEANDKITAINGKPVNFYSDLKTGLHGLANKPITLTLERDGQQLQKSGQMKDCDLLGIGIQSTTNLQDLIVSEKLSVGQSIVEGWNRTLEVVFGQVKAIGVIASVEGGRKQLAGPLGILMQIPAEWDWTFWWSFTALISAWLAFINLLPIPGLDGGHVLFTLIEMVSGKKLSDKFLEQATTVGFILLMGLMLFIFVNDGINLFGSATEEVVDPAVKCFGLPT